MIFELDDLILAVIAFRSACSSVTAEKNIKMSLDADPSSVTDVRVACHCVVCRKPCGDSVSGDVSETSSDDPLRLPASKKLREWERRGPTAESRAFSLGVDYDDYLDRPLPLCSTCVALVSEIDALEQRLNEKFRDLVRLVRGSDDDGGSDAVRTPGLPLPSVDRLSNSNEVVVKVEFDLPADLGPSSFADTVSRSEELTLGTCVRC
jgi:hypothetical protein